MLHGGDDDDKGDDDNDGDVPWFGPAGVAGVLAPLLAPVVSIAVAVLLLVMVAVVSATAASCSTSCPACTSSSMYAAATRSLPAWQHARNRRTGSPAARGNRCGQREGSVVRAAETTTSW